MTRLLEVTDRVTPTQQVTVISRELDKFEDKSSLLRILAQAYEINNIGISKAKKWVAKMYNVFDSEINADYSTYDDLGDVVYYLDSQAEKQGDFSLQTIIRLLELDCSKIDSDQFTLLSESITSMSALARKWFIRFWLRTPRNGINSGTVTKVIAKHYNKKLKEVKKHLNFNSVETVITSYENEETPSTNLVHGSFVSPMLAKEVPMEKWPTNKIVDYKYDGNRYQIHLEDKNVIIFNRKGKVVTHQFTDIAELVSGYPIHNGIFDGEIYPIKEDGSPDEHKKMATRVHSKNHQEALDKVAVKWVIFDCLKLNDETIMDISFSERLKKIKNVPNQAHRMKDDNVMAFYNQAINDGFEGIIVKNADVPYEAGKRSAFWAKYKPPRIELDVVIMSAKYGEGKRANVFGTFEIGVKSDKGIVSVGKVGTGFSDADLVSLTHNLRRNVENFENDTYYFLPRVVLEVSADLVSRDEKGNLGLRFPRCKRIRDDKFAADINTLEDVERLE
tara:strand:- start:2910 stop:4421 length:1512 start_codon:yes stop_codon:yes gene_type:complete